ncbi:MAG TPA: SDR family NAD(P)-dependent oxidoreductase [Nocardioides sp.]|uniref:SDR family NAD(P)-dependent oxidoreductase n=1 Tax=Nocardioides sp. TaxID=35761 RepID=UPI002E317C9F|nr:SDR family NAD(P)-dependent oxidoreductase [Nocardioides sp.]HEX3930005.1 SDR family NAD(P)-dependent oxidoreductase [Nocardioides sp.]
MSPAAELVDLHDRVAVVTGAAQGIGFAIARRLAEAGAATVLTDLREDVELAAERLRREDGAAEVEAVVLDASSVDDQEALAAGVLARHGRLDIWVNNAGIYPVHPTLSMTPDEWRSVLSLNLDGTFFGAQAAGRRMVERGQGVIVNVASTSAFRVSNDGVAHYAASKSAVTGLTRALARELGPAGVRVLGVAPVLTVTESTAASTRQVAAAQASGTTEDAVLDRYASRIPLRRTATPEDIARVVLFCVSDLAQYVTGHTVPVDGGFLVV